ncbi:PREDICTED: centromere protein X isoform X1 [Sturnus vulgaris]|uniref:centromere protein X isoform X1 n=1 Tax=Sturnus vulgaris TaxID=9172 RepID=UPI00071A6467|nr:PREDICTED: centromere protein X isoform X1 [Sturnus vulgaris]
MEERGGRAGGFRKDTVDRLLRLYFRDGRTRVNTDAQLLMAEMLKVFVRGHQPAGAPRPLSRPFPFFHLGCRSGGTGSAAGSGRGPEEGGYGAAGESVATAASGFLEAS